MLLPELTMKASKLPCTQGTASGGNEFCYKPSAIWVSNNPASLAGSGVGTGKVKPFDYTYTSKGNPGYRNPSVISMQCCNRMPAAG